MQSHSRQECFSFPGSALERTAPEALPRFALQTQYERMTVRQAEPARQWVPRQSLGTSNKPKRLPNMDGPICLEPSLLAQLMARESLRLCEVQKSYEQLARLS